MLFSFNIFWKYLLTFILGWGLYGIAGFDFACITLISFLICTQYSDKNMLI